MNITKELEVVVSKLEENDFKDFSTLITKIVTEGIFIPDEINVNDENKVVIIYNGFDSRDILRFRLSPFKKHECISREHGFTRHIDVKPDLSVESVNDILVEYYKDCVVKLFACFVEEREYSKSVILTFLEKMVANKCWLSTALFDQVCCIIKNIPVDAVSLNTVKYHNGKELRYDSLRIKYNTNCSVKLFVQVKLNDNGEPNVIMYTDDIDNEHELYRAPVHIPLPDVVNKVIYYTTGEE